MAVLSDGTIRELLDRGDLVITPFNPEEQIKPGSVDLRLAGEVVSESTGVEKQYDEGEEIKFHPGQSYLAAVKETIDLPPYLLGSVKGRSSIGRMFLQIHCAGLADPGWRGELTLEITNLGSNPKTLSVGDRVCQVKFEVLDKPAEKPYGVLPDSKYQDQKGVTRSRFEGK